MNVVRNVAHTAVYSWKHKAGIFFEVYLYVERENVKRQTLRESNKDWNDIMIHKFKIISFEGNHMF